MIDLADEFSTACCSVTPERFATLRAADVPDSVFDPPTVGMAPIETHAGGLFDIVDHGGLAVIVPCGVWRDPNWDIEDLVAFKLSDPARWWCRMGVADLLGDVGFTIKSKRLHATPLDWLRAGGKGLVILDWQTDPVDLLVGAGHLVADRSMLTRLRNYTVKAATARLDGMVCHG